MLEQESFGAASTIGKRGEMKERTVLRWRLAGLLVAMLVIVALPYVVTRNSAADATRARDWVTHTAEVRARAFALEATLRDSEAAIYAMLAGTTGPALDERAKSAHNEAAELVRELRALTSDNNNQQVRVGSLESMTIGRITLMDQALARMASGDKAGAYASMADAARLFPFRNALNAIIADEDQLLARRRVEAQRLDHNNQLILSGTSVAQIILLVILVVLSERQIAQRLEAEAVARFAVQRSGLIVQAVREPIAMLDAKLNTLLVNEAFGELYGVEDLSVSAPLSSLGNGAWNAPALLQRLSDVLARDRELWDFEMNQRTVDGVDRTVVINARRLEEPGNDHPAVLLTVSDITARALVEQQVNELNRQLEGKVEQISDVNRELEAFSYSVSHDLRAPLRHIAGFSGKLETHLAEAADERARHYIDVIGSSARRMAQLIDDLLVFSRLGRGALRLQPVDTQSLVEQARALVETEALDRQIEWVIEPLPIVVGDENMLRTVWQNLLGNAIKYTAHRERARIEVKAERGRSGDWEFSVSDNGAGFDMQYAAKLFGVFQRLHRASEFPGNGIGLANVRRIIARHGGRTWAEGEVERGATFHFSLPSSGLGKASSTGEAA
jgi:signal transduction histidine kinase